jgi:ubiquinone/menaquinone biosynthesis C-methylase UbiE
VDRFPCGAAELLCDITKALPFREDSIDEVYLDNVIEHIHDIPSLMREIFRISKPGAIVTIITPHLSSLASWRDSTHVHQFSYFSFDHFTKPSVATTWRRLCNPAPEFVFRRGFLGVAERIVFRISPEFYERKVSFLFRTSTLSCVLQVLKNEENVTGDGINA